MREQGVISRAGKIRLAQMFDRIERVRKRARRRKRLNVKHLIEEGRV